MYSMITARFHLCVIALMLSALMISFLGCSKPAVNVGAVDGSVRSIDNWTIEWHGHAETVSQTTIQGLQQTKSKYSLPEYCLAYIGDIKQALTHDHDFTFYDNVPATGRLVVTLYGVNVPRAGLTKTEAERVMEELSGDWPQSGHVESAIRDEGFDWGRADIVRQVVVTVHNIEGKVLAKIFVGGNSDDRVKPDHVADAISNALQQK